MGNGMFGNGFSSENKTANRNNETRKQLTSKIISGIASELNDKKAAEAAAQRRKYQGNGKFTKAGSDDRVNGSMHKLNDFKFNGQFPSEDELSYWYGYTVHGGRRLLAVVEELVKEGKYDEVAKIAERDYKHIFYEEDLGMVTNNSVYMEAYNKIASKGKLR